MSELANLNLAIEACKAIEDICPYFGCHVALTGGCLYKGGDRKDVDILFYRIRQVPLINVSGLMNKLVEIGFDEPVGFGWIYKSNYKGINFDMFFPESDGDEDYAKANGNPLAEIPK